MPKVEVPPSPSILTQAERELGAFLRAVTNLVGPEGLSHARDLWIETLRDADCPATESTSFFRSVTIHTISQLVKSSQGRTPPGINTPGINAFDFSLNICG